MSEQNPSAESLFLAALEKSSRQERTAFLEEVCAGKPELLRRVEELLQAHDESVGPLDVVPSGLETTIGISPVMEGPGSLIGPYKLLQKIGEGGMGVVYMAEQERPVRRRVALKIIKPGMDTAQVINRFEAERQALAMMDHQNIARVLDAGATETGRPYFVMELINGIPITRYSDEAKLTPRERLELFVPVCKAIQHAHQKGIIHRDVKPSNVLVTMYDGKAVPKVIDFGVAKATGQSLVEKTMFTQFGALVGTFEYMSPEQAEMSALGVDTRSDIYSLGVLLYELLTGSTPLSSKSLREVAFVEMLKMIRDQEPELPSQHLSTSERLATIAAARKTEPTRLSKLVRGELDWIVMKALEKDRTRRYETANGLAKDIERYLGDEPVEACPPSTYYKLSKFARKNRKLLATAGAFLLLLCLGVAISTWQAIRATIAQKEALVGREEAEIAKQQALDEEEKAKNAEKKIVSEQKRAVNEAAIAQEINSFLLQDLLRQADPREQAIPGRLVDPNLQLRTVVDRASEKLEGRFKEQPLVEAGLRMTLGSIYSSLERNEESLRHRRRAYEIYRQVHGENHRDTLTALNDISITLKGPANLAEAEKLGRRALAGREELLGLKDNDTLESAANLGLILEKQAKFDEAETLLRRAFEGRKQNKGPNYKWTLWAEMSLGKLCSTRDKDKEAGDLLTDSYERMKEHLSEDSPLTISAANNLASFYLQKGEYTKAESLLLEVRPRQLRIFGEGSQAELINCSNLGHCYARQGFNEKAEKLLAEGLERSKKIDPEHPTTLLLQKSLAMVYSKIRKFDKAERLLRQTLEGNIRILGETYPDTIILRTDLAIVLSLQNKYQEALELNQIALRQAEQVFGKLGRTTIAILHNLAFLYRDMGQPAQSTKTFEEAISRLNIANRQDAESFFIRLNYASFLNIKGQPKSAEDQIQQALRSLSKPLADTHPWMLTARILQAKIQEKLGNAGEAIKQLDQLVSDFTKIHGKKDIQTIQVRESLAELLMNTGDFERAKGICDDVLEIQLSTLGEDDPLTWTAQFNLAKFFGWVNDWDGAEPLLEIVLAKRRKQLPENHPDVLQTILALGSCRQNLKKFAGAEPLKQEYCQRSEKLFGESHVKTIGAQSELGVLYFVWGKKENAVHWLGKAFDNCQQSLGENDPSTVIAALSFGDALYLANKLEDAEIKYSYVLDHISTLATGEHFHAFESVLTLGEQLLRNERTAKKAFLLSERALNLARTYPGENQSNLAFVLLLNGRLLIQGKRFPEAENLLRECLELREKNVPGHWSAENVRSWLGEAILGQNRFADAERFLIEGFEKQLQKEEEIPLEASTNLIEALKRLIRLYEEWGKSEQAESWRVKLKAQEGKRFIDKKAFEGFQLLRQNKFQEAEALLRECLAFRQKSQPDHWLTFNMQSLVGDSLLGQKKFAEAEPLLLAGNAGLIKCQSQIPKEAKIRLIESQVRLVNLFNAIKNKERLVESQKKLDELILQLNGEKK